MKLDYATIGENIRTLREQKGLSQESLIDLINEKYGSKYTRQRLSHIENGEGGRVLNLNILNALAEIFECDAGYLLGEIKERTYDIKEVCEITSLSEEAVSKILSWKNGHGSKRYNAKIWGKQLSDIITHDNFSSVMNSVTTCIIDMKIYNKYIMPKFAAGNISEETKNNEEETYNEYVSNLWHISNEFSDIIKDMANRNAN